MSEKKEFTAEELNVKYTELAGKQAQIKADFDKDIESKQSDLDIASKALTDATEAHKKALERMIEKSVSEKAIEELKSTHEKALKEKLALFKELKTDLEKAKSALNRPSTETTEGKEMDEKKVYIDSQKKLSKYVSENLGELSSISQEVVIGKGAKAMATDSLQDGGNLITSEVRLNTILEIAQPIGTFAELCNNEFMANGDTLVITVDTSTGDSTGSSYVGEHEGRDNNSTPLFKDLRIVAFTQEIACPVTEKMLSNTSFNTVGYADKHCMKKLKQDREWAYIRAEGKGGPVGVLSLPDGTGFGKVKRLTTAGSGVIAFTDINTAIGDIDPIYHNDLAIIMSPTCKTMLSGQVGSDGHPLFKDALMVGQRATYMGMPVVVNTHLDAVAANGEVAIIGSMKDAYTTLDVGGADLLVDRFTARPLTKFISTVQNGGAPVKTEAMRVLKIKA